MQRDLRFFLNQLKTANKLLCIRKEVDPKFELPAVMKVAEKLGKGILFEKVKGSRFSVINNLFGARDLLAILFDTTPDRLANEWVNRVKNPIEPKLVSSGPVKEVVKKDSEVNLGELPIVTHSSKDAGPYITGGILVAKDPGTGIRNVSIHRMQYKGRNRLGIRMLRSQDLDVIQQKCEKEKKDLEIAVVIGNHPFETLVAAGTVAYGIDEFSFSSGLRKEPLELVKCETVDLEVPAMAEIVLEGKIRAMVREPEGPFGDFQEYYSLVGEGHVFEVKALTHRRDAIYQTIQAASPEDVYLLALSREAKVYEAVSKIADVQAVSLAPMIFSCMISIKKHFEGEPKKVAAAAFGAYSWLKYCVVVDHDVDVFDVNEVWWAISTRSRPETGLLLIKSAHGFPRDPFYLHQSKLGIDATVPLNHRDRFERKKVSGANSIRLEDYL